MFIGTYGICIWIWIWIWPHAYMYDLHLDVTAFNINSVETERLHHSVLVVGVTLSEISYTQPPRRVAERSASKSSPFSHITGQTK